MNALNKLAVSKRLLPSLLVALVVPTFVLGMLTTSAQTAVTSPAPAARVSFTFDDGLESTAANAAPTLAKHGLTGTDYVITDCVGMNTVPNSCRANTGARYMSWSQIQNLQNSRGWEIGSHTADHYCLASNRSQDPGDCQQNTLTTSQVDYQLSASKNALAAHGINATDMSTPYGDYNMNVLAEIAKYYGSMRGFQDRGMNTWPNDDYLVRDFTVKEVQTPVSSVKSAIDQAIASNSWLVLTFHDIKQSPSQKPNDFQYGTDELDQIAAYVQAKQATGLIQSIHVNQGLVTSASNLLPNGTFNNGLSGGWTTPNPGNVTLNTGNNGSYPDPTNSIKFTAGSSAARLYSPRVSVDASNTYMLKSYLNVTSVNSGDVEYYIDEYDASGNWISGQYKKAETTAFVEDMNFAYTPTSAQVASADLQLTVAANSGIRAYVDNFQWFPLSSHPLSNLMPNGSFDAGIAQGWTTDDPAHIVADGGNHGSPNNPVNSVRFASLSTSANSHLFSPKVTVSSSASYSVTSYLNLAAASSKGVGLYIDEYDASGNWISGQYKATAYSAGPQNVGFTYQPTSDNVHSASLQVIFGGNSNTSGYFDDVRWYAN